MMRLLCFCLAALTLAAAPALADDPIDPFVGTYLGYATVRDDAGSVTEDREMDIVIEKRDGGAFTITWTNVSLVEGRRDIPGVKRRVDQVTLFPTDRPGVYVEEERGSMFSRSEDVEPLEGDPLRWAQVGNGRISVFSFVILEDGSYQLQIYQRMLTETGMDILFQRIVDGTVERQIEGSTARVGEAGEITE